MAASLTVQAFVEYLLSMKRDRFKFSPHGDSSRHWVTTVLDDFARAEVLLPSANHSFEEEIKEKNMADPFQYPIPASQGMFY